METKATAKGQIVIPSSIRRTLNVRKGTRIQIEVDEQANEIILRPITRRFIHSLRGKYKCSGLMDELITEKQLEC
jgi:AbrB family looped-hinge helix DNA binding protein